MDKPLPPIPADVEWPGSEREIDDFNEIVCKHAQAAIERARAELTALFNQLEQLPDEEDMRFWLNGYLDNLNHDVFDGIIRQIERNRGDGYERDGESEYSAYARENSVSVRNGY